MLETAATRHPGANIAGVSVQKMIRGGVEVIAGMTRDPQFGPMIMFGLGGIFVEILKDVSFRIVPLTEEDAYEMLSELRGRPLLEGARGARPVKKEALVDILIKLSRFIEGNPEIKELDINPILADDQGAVAVDARIILE
jgi:acyl-CoA synthetase (NDP forming)